MANIEVIVKEWLETIVGEDYNVSADMPDPRPAQFIIIDRTGGDREAMVLDRAEILIEVYDKDSRLTASEKANEIADAITGLLAYEDNITRAEINSVVNLPDLTAQYNRYQIYCDIYHRR